ncbi:MAG: hypothetical protein NT069_20475 [Planctomycetota bacterium]|nr:hypothetical protein [Planctomycetota bacterium]
MQRRKSSLAAAFRFDPPLDFCGTLISRVTLTITPQDSTATGKLQVTAGGAVWEKKDIPPNELSFFREPGGDNHVLNLVSATGYCVYPPTIRLQALPTSLAGSRYVTAADIGCAPAGGSDIGGGRVDPCVCTRCLWNIACRKSRATHQPTAYLS